MSPLVMWNVELLRKMKVLLTFYFIVVRIIFKVCKEIKKWICVKG